MDGEADGVPAAGGPPDLHEALEVPDLPGAEVGLDDLHALVGEEQEEEEPAALGMVHAEDSDNDSEAEAGEEEVDHAALRGLPDQFDPVQHGSSDGGRCLPRMALALGLGALLVVGGAAAGMRLRRPASVHIIPADLPRTAATPELDADAHWALFHVGDHRPGLAAASNADTDSSATSALRLGAEVLPDGDRSVHVPMQFGTVPRAAGYRTFRLPRPEPEEAEEELDDAHPVDATSAASAFRLRGEVLPRAAADRTFRISRPEPQEVELLKTDRAAAVDPSIDCGVVTERGPPCYPHGITPAFGATTFRLRTEGLPNLHGFRLPRDEEEVECPVAATSTEGLMPTATTAPPHADRLARAAARRRPEEEEEEEDLDDHAGRDATNLNHGERVLFPLVDCGGVTEHGPCNPRGITDIVRAANADTNRAFGLARRAAARPEEEETEEVDDAHLEEDATSAASAFRLTAEVLPRAAADRVHFPAVDCGLIGRGPCFPFGATSAFRLNRHAAAVHPEAEDATGRLNLYLIPIIVLLVAVITVGIILHD